ncbi:MAG: FAD-dependent oxidoreductase [Candidatus Omnitrophica bacterium]|nr:FAD-dependent oxidoreductase [Candidatus Omnitrophota bacterium]
MITLETTLSDVIQRAEGVKSFRFKVGKPTSFLAGQFFFVTIRINGEERTKHFSFSNSPTEARYIEFTKRITSSEYSTALDTMKVGDWARLKLPLGAFTLENERSKIAFLSGGIGITPIRSMIKYVVDTKLQTDIVLLYSNRTEDQIIFRGDFDEMQNASANIRIVYTLTSKELNKASWNGRTGYVNEGMIKEEIPDYLERVFYVCGPPAMVNGMMDILKNKLSISQDNLKSENFTGY